MIARVIQPGLGLLLILALCAGIAYWLVGRGQLGQGKGYSSGGSDSSPPTGTAPPSLSEPRVHVQVVHPVAGGVALSVERPGTINSFQYALLFTKVSGFLRNQTVDIGSVVRPNQLLAEVYAPEIGADVRKAEADRRKAKSDVMVMEARLEEAKANLRQANDKLAQAQADLQSARALQTLRTEQFTRMQRLAKLNAIEQELVDEKRAAKHSAEAVTVSTEKAVSTAKSAVTAAMANIARSRAELEDAHAEVQVAEAVLERARALQAYTEVRAPFGGIITQRGYHEGDFIRDAANGGVEKAVLTVARTDLMRVIVWVPDPAVPFTRAGLPATVHVDALADVPFSGKVARTAGSEDPLSRTMRTEIDLPNPEGLLADGMYGKITIHLEKKKAAVTVPSAALVGDEHAGERSVYVVAGGQAHHRGVRVGLDDGIRAEILRGLKVEDLVVIQHGPGLADGVPVAVVNTLPAK